jgi:hypothetical protein
MAQCKPASVISATRFAGKNLVISSINDFAVEILRRSSRLCSAFASTFDVP